jgi:hypothetical protein
MDFTTLFLHVKINFANNDYPQFLFIQKLKKMENLIDSNEELNENKDSFLINYKLRMILSSVARAAVFLSIVLFIQVLFQTITLLLSLKQFVIKNNGILTTRETWNYYYNIFIGTINIIPAILLLILNKKMKELINQKSELSLYYLFKFLRNYFRWIAAMFIFSIISAFIFSYLVLPYL